MTMHNDNKLFARAALGAVLAAAAFGASAQTAGTWMVDIGAAQVRPQVSSGSLTAPSAPNTQIDVRSDTQPIVTVTRMVTDNWSVAVPIGAGFKAKITGAGGIAGVGQIAEARSIPVSVFAQYRFLAATDRIRPYAMLGLTYAYFTKERGSATLSALNPLNPAGGTGLSIDSKLALSPGVGVTAFINDQWFVDVQYVKTLLKTQAKLSTGQTIDAKLDPDLFKIGVGMRF
jgi:outer membrane protein